MSVATGPQVQPEAIAQSYAKEGAINPSRSAEEQRTYDRGQEIRKRYDNSKSSDPLAALKKQEGSQDQVTKRIQAETDLTSCFGTEATPATAGTSEGDRLQKAQDIKEGLLTLQDRGVEALTPEQKKIMVDAVIAKALTGRLAFDGLKPEDKQAIAEGLLGRSEVRSQLTDLLAGKMKPEDMEKALESANKVTEAQKTRDAKEAEYAKKHGERFNKSHELRIKELKWQDVVNGDKKDLFEQLEDDEEDMQASIAEAKTYLSGIDKAVADATTEKVRAEIAAGNGNGHLITADEIAAYELITNENKLQELSDLRSLPDQANALRAEVDKLDYEEEAAARELRSEERALADAKDAKTVQEEALLTHMESVSAEAVDSFLDADIKARAEAANQFFEEEMKNTVDDDDRTMKKGIKDRWEESKKKRGRQVSQINKKQVKKDYATLVKDGPEEVIRNMMIDAARRKFPNVNSPEYAAEVTHIEEKMKDPKFVEGHKVDVAKGIVNRFILSGGKPLPDDVRLFRDSEWGAGLITAALENQEALKAELEKLADEGQLDSKGIFNKLGRHARSGGLMGLLAVLLMGGGVFAKLIPSAAKSEFG